MQEYIAEKERQGDQIKEEISNIIPSRILIQKILSLIFVYSVKIHVLYTNSGNPERTDSNSSLNRIKGRIYRVNSEIVV